ncbi:MAG: MBL fold metallo-hydrolase [Treponema sp.]|nr:MBL fold metallo-hydrolase [Candidatus Treponema equifaecale]
MKILRTGPLGVNTLIVPLVRNLVLIVDPACCKFSRDEEKLSNYLKENNLQPAVIVLTHGHFDHVSGLPSLYKSFPNTPILIHKADSDLIGPDSQKAQYGHLYPMGFDVFLPFVSNLPAATAFLEDEKNLLELLPQYAEDSELAECLQKWCVIHTPGHTPGCCCLYNEDDLILISGDTMFYHSWGRTDLPGGNESEIQKSLLKIAEIVEEDALVFPGHETSGFKLEENL